jgi:hypothetical protein
MCPDSITYTGFGVSDYLAGQMGCAALSNIAGTDDARWDRSVYGQDSWKLTPRLTINAGLRYDYLHKDASDQHYLWMGRMATVFGIALSVAAAYAATHFNNIMDFLQFVFAFVNAPLFATFLLGMFWKRTTGHAAFGGLLSGTAAAAIHQAWLCLSGRYRVSKVVGWQSCMAIPAKWRRISGRPFGPGACVSGSRSW